VGSVPWLADRVFSIMLARLAALPSQRP
jgi:hypothetical protein